MNAIVKDNRRDTTQATALIQSDAQALEVAEELAAIFVREAAERDRERRLPHAELEQFSRSGLWGITVPKEYGGADVSAATLAKVVARISRADSSLGHIPQNHYYALELLRLNGSPVQQQRLYAEVLSGARFGNAHAELGTRTAQDRATRLRHDGSGYRIDGRKFYSTGALFAQRIPTSAVDEDGVLQFAFVPRSASGLKIVDDWSGFGQRTSGSGSVIFDNVRVEADDIVPLQSVFEHPTRLGPFAQILHAAIDAGIARAAYEDTLAFVREHARPWIDSGHEQASNDPLTLAEIGRLTARLHAAEALLEEAGEVLDQVQDEANASAVAAASIVVAKARAITTEISLNAASKLFELSGSRATLAAHNLDRHWRNARTHTLHDPVRWKYHAIGNYYLNDTLPPRRGTI